MDVPRVVATPAALAVIAALKAQHGPLVFHQSGGCCDNGGANCFPAHELPVGPGDLQIGEIGGTPFYVSKAAYEFWKRTQFIIDVVRGSHGNFSLEGPNGEAFFTRSRLFTDEEWQALLASGVVSD